MLVRIARRLWRRFNRAPDDVLLVGLGDYCGDRCDEHAYCIAIRDTLNGLHATLVTAVDSEDLPAVYTFGLPVDPDGLLLARHRSPLIRAAFAVARCAGARAGLADVGEIQT